jgi:DNA repair protein RecN (Recombination protein N)
MLKALSIKNYALIDQLSIEFGNGFSVITGETGAGKSILLGALSVILGKRADLGVLKDKAVKCVIEGEFDVSAMNLKPLFRQYDLDYDETSFLRREILPSGKSRAFINDTPVNLAVLKELGQKLVDIHSQHQTLMLADSGFQLRALDSYLGNLNIVNDYKVFYKQYVSLFNELAALQDKQALLKQEEDYLKFQFEELDAVLLNADSFKEMEERQQFLSHAEEVIAALNLVDALLQGDEHNVIDKILLITETLSSVADFCPKAEELLRRLESVRLELKDMADETATLHSEGDINPMELSELTEKLDEIYRLQQKHRVATIDELAALKEEYSERLLGITNLENSINRVSKELQAVRAKLEQKAAVLSKARKNGIPKLAGAVQLVLQKLGMQDAQFKVVIQTQDKFTNNGKDKIDFWFSANKGVAPGEISKIASGGELSRLMLAIKSLINEKSVLPTVVFDEIDSGVSGDIAGKVGNIMKEMANNHQLIVISHLPQIASKADAHYKVYKEATSNSTQTSIVLLDDNQRVDEIATMLSDEKVTTIAREAAKELLR